MTLPPDTFRAQIIEAKRRLQQLLGEQGKINQEIEDLRNLIRANANFLPEGEREREMYFLEFLRHPANITEAVRLAIFIASINHEKITPTEIKTTAEMIGFDFSEYSNPMASVHTILKRMREADPPQVDYEEGSGGYWFGNLPDDLVNPALIEEIFSKAIDEVVRSADVESTLATTSKVTAEALGKINLRIRRNKGD
jgi:hypothetical protein